MRNRIALFAVMLGLSLSALIRADDNVRAVQEKLRDGGFYSAEIDGAYSSDLSAALSRYQIRNGLPITGQLDTETAKALDAKPAVGPSTPDAEQSSETWRRLRKGERRTSTKAQERSSPRTDEAAETSAETRPRSAPAATARTSSETRQPASAPATALDTGSPAPEFSTERLRDYVAAFVLAGFDRNVGAETEFFADRVQYYDQGVIDREKIREDLKRYDERWPERHFWVAGAINVEPQSDNRVGVTFPLGFKLRNGNRTVTGKVIKSLVLEATGDDLQIVAVNEVSENKK
jgi:peptidoglycan hydrolase-like protein with peptidoglycan-binding domain